MLPYALE